MLTWQDAIVAAAPIIIAWLLWRIQAFSINRFLRGGMYRLLRYQRTTYNIVSWFGVLIHEISHAVVMLLGGHGITQFRVGVDSGHVTPKQVRKGPLGTLTFIAAALAPMVAAPAAIAAFLLIGRPLPEPSTAAGFRGVQDNLATISRDMVERLVVDLVGMDVTTWMGASLLLLAVFAMPSARPSHVKNKGEADEGDIAVVRALIKRRPLPVILFWVLIYGAYFAVVPFWPQFYWLAWQMVWSIGIVGAALAIIMGLVWYAVAWTGRIQRWLAWIPYALAVAVQVGGRLLDWHGSTWLLNLLSVAVLLGLAFALRTVAPRRF